MARLLLRQVSLSHQAGRFPLARPGFFISLTLTHSIIRASFLQLDPQEFLNLGTTLPYTRIPNRCEIEASSLLSQHRWISSPAHKPEEKLTIGPQRTHHEDRNPQSTVTYNGPISSTIKKVKLLSLSTCCLSASLGPIITFMTSPGMNVVVKGAVASTVILLSASTTAALHWFVSPYIHKLEWQPGSDSFTVEKLTWLATYSTESVKFGDIKDPNTKRPFVTFSANGKYYYVDEEHVRNKALLARLTAKKPEFESAFKNL